MGGQTNDQSTTGEQELYYCIPQDLKDCTCSKQKDTPRVYFQGDRLYVSEAYWICPVEDNIKLNVTPFDGSFGISSKPGKTELTIKQKLVIKY